MSNGRMVDYEIDMQAFVTLLFDTTINIYPKSKVLVKIKKVLVLWALLSLKLFSTCICFYD